MTFIHLVYVLLIIFALFSVFSKNLKRAIVGSGAFGLWVSIAYIFYHAPDVAIAEAIISSALSTILFIIAIKNYDDISSKQRKFDWRQGITYAAVALSLGAVVYLTHMSTPFITSAIGDMVMDSFFNHGATVNPVTGVVLNYRVFDTVFEALLLLVSSVGVVHLVNSAKIKKNNHTYSDDPWHERPDFGNANIHCSYVEKAVKGEINTDNDTKTVTMRHKKHPSAVMTITFMIPVVSLISFYLIVGDPLAPGGGFQGGALLAAVFVSHYLIMPDHPVSIKFLNNLEKMLFLLLVSVMISYVLLGIQNHLPLQFHAPYFILTDAVLGIKVFCGLSIMFLSFAREHNKV